jgi:hypothetical protein
MECCGNEMDYKDYWNVRIYTCTHRSHHPQYFVNLATGEQIYESNGY